MFTKNVTWNVNPLDNGSTLSLTTNELLALSVWLVAAYHNEDIKPLWVESQGIIARRDGHVVFLKGMEGSLGQEGIINFLKTLDNITRLGQFIEGKHFFGVSFNDWCEGPRGRWGVYIKEEINQMGWWDLEGTSIIPVVLQFSSTLDLWQAWEPGTQSKEAALGEDIFNKLQSRSK